MMINSFLNPLMSASLLCILAGCNGSVDRVKINDGQHALDFCRLKDQEAGAQFSKRHTGWVVFDGDVSIHFDESSAIVSFTDDSPESVRVARPKGEVKEPLLLQSSSIEDSLTYGIFGQSGIRILLNANAYCQSANSQRQKTRDKACPELHHFAAYIDGIGLMYGKLTEIKHGKVPVKGPPT